MMKALIVDDEAAARENLRLMLEEHCPKINVVGTAGNAKEARKAIQALSPEALFLDIKMPGEDGFALLRSLKDHHMSVVFTTAYDQFALQAFRQNALDYLEKPIDVQALKRACDKLLRMHNANGAPTHDLPGTAEAIERSIEKGMLDDRLAIPSRDGIVLLEYPDILYLEASDSYTEVHMIDGKRHVSSKNIRLFEQHLDPKSFFRIHKSYIINLQHLKGFDRNEGNMAVLSNKVLLPVSRRRVSDFLGLISTF